MPVARSTAPRLRLIAGAAALVLLGASCASSSAGPHPSKAPDAATGTPPALASHTPVGTPSGVAEIPTKWPIKHVVFLIKENRSFDNLFGRFPGADGVRVGWDEGQRRPLTPATDQRAADIPHCYWCSVKAYDHGKMDGFNQSVYADRYAYTQMRPSGLPNYWHWAQQNVLADDFFSSAMGPSFPNHMYSIAGQSGGAHDNPVRTPGLGSNTFGCDAPKGEYVKVVDTEGHVSNIPPCFNMQTEGDLLTKAGIGWADYSATPKQKGYLWSAYAAIKHIRETKQWQEHIFPVDNVIPDIKANRLPAVTWITPRFELSEHPEYNFCFGENWTTQVIDAIMNSPAWSSTAIFITWDEYGGFYDHVPPPQVDRFGFGIRVPLLVISPYAKQGVVDHHLGEFDSVLRFIEDDFGLTQLTHRDRHASDLSYDFDFHRSPRPPDPLPLRTDCKGTIYSPAPAQ